MKAEKAHQEVALCTEKNPQNLTGFDDGWGLEGEQEIHTYIKPENVVSVVVVPLLFHITRAMEHEESYWLFLA